jgi:O-antigen biosynthesis protein
MISIRPIGSVDSAELLEESSGHVVFVLESDALRADAVAVIESHLEDAPDLVIAYGNESWENPSGRVPVRSWKPAWSPERLRGQEFVGFPVVISRSLLRMVGGIRAELGDLALYDLVLRASEHADRVTRMPEVLHHTSRPRTWGRAGSDHELESRQRVIQEHLDRVGVDAVARTHSAWQTRIDRKLLEQPLVSIIIPTAGTVKRIRGRDSVLVEDCVRSVVDRSSYSNFEIIVVHDEATVDERLVDRLRALGGARLRCVPFTGEFNFSEKVNRGVIKSSGDVLLLLNDDTVVISPGWIEELLCHLQEPDVGIVGPKLLLGDGRIQSAGHFFSDGASHVAAGCSNDELGPEFELAVAAERSGITMACAAIRRDVFDQVGGLCVELPRAYNDVDFCNKLAAAGFRMVWTPWVELYHFESLSRDPTVSAFEIELLADRWGTLSYSPDAYLPHFDVRLAGVNYISEDDPTFVGMLGWPSDRNP